MKFSYKRIKKTFIVCALASVTLAVLILLFVGEENSFNIFRDDASYPLSDDYIKFLDVGQGDSALISSNGKTALIDMGPSTAATALASKLSGSNVEDIDVALLSHFHEDHIGGLEYIYSAFPIKNLLIPDFHKTDEDTSVVRRVWANIDANGGGVYTVIEGVNINVGEFTVTILGYYPDLDNENNRSVFAMVESNGTNFLFTGDAEKEAEYRIIENSVNIKCDVLKVAHHGSATSSTKKFLEAAQPDHCVISVGLGNQYSHPNDNVLARYEEKDLKVYRTDLLGDITFNVNNGKIKVFADNE